MFYFHLVYFMSIWCILWPFAIFYGRLLYFMITYLVYIVFLVLVRFSKKILATLVLTFLGKNIKGSAFG
jgi:hypothetical protein